MLPPVILPVALTTPVTLNPAVPTTVIILAVLVLPNQVITWPLVAPIIKLPTLAPVPTGPVTELPTTYKYPSLAPNTLAPAKAPL